MTKAQRLRRLEELLLIASHEGGFTTPVLAQRLGVSRQTVWRDIEELSPEVPIHETDDGRYWIEPMRYLSSVRLSVAESLMLYLAMRHMMRKTSYAPPSMISAMEKLALVLRPPVSPQLAASTQVVQAEREADMERTQVWETLIRAWIEQITVRITYQSSWRAETVGYEFQPHLFEPALLSEGVYVIGLSVTHDAVRTFKVERIVRAELTTLSFKRPEDIDVDAMLRHAWGVWYGPELCEVRLRFSERVARRVKETIWHPSQQLCALSDGGVEWRVQIAGVTELIPWLRGWGPDVEVLAPPELRQVIAEDMQRAAELYRSER